MKSACCHQPIYLSKVNAKGKHLEPIQLKINTCSRCHRHCWKEGEWEDIYKKALERYDEIDRINGLSTKKLHA